MINENVTLGFDPKKVTERCLKEIFSQETARTLWLAIKQGHFTAPHFKEGVLRCSIEIEKALKKGTLNADCLFKILSGFGKGPTVGIIGLNERGFAEELLPFIMGEKAITYKIGSQE